MADGAGIKDTASSGTDMAVMQIAARLGSAEAEVRERVTHRELVSAINGLRGDLGSKIDQSHTMQIEQMAQLLSASSAGRDAEIVQAVNRALEEREKREDSAREKVDRQIQDAYHGARAALMAQGGGVVMIIILGGYFLLKSLGIEL